MSLALVSLNGLLDQRRVWRGRAATAHALAEAQPTGHAGLDACLPSGGWPPAALSELLLAAPGCGELHLLWPSLARLTQAGERIALVAPPWVPNPVAWEAAGVRLGQLAWVRAEGSEALWAAEQCLRSGACGAVLCWPLQADDRALRRLQVAAETGHTLGFVLRGQAAAHNPSPAALRLAIDACPAQWRVLKCRGGVAPTQPIRWLAG